ncbi:uncharacterized protein LOC136073024 [Hydra vulgaris]|uniref:uncharacterized protein LOC136073024 n=1 Tax=Hydra vulgaris TaxID=6087 RepID=UPI0032E9D8BD
MSSKNNFLSLKKKDEKIQRKGLIYSPSSKSVFCYVCKLFGNCDQGLCTTGFSDWKNATSRLPSHETSHRHVTSVPTVSTFQNRWAYWQSNGLLELISKFDPFLAGHIGEYDNKGKGHVKYLSSQTVAAILKVMFSKVQQHFVKEIQEAKYFGIIIGSTPDITHFDQLCLVVRYVNLLSVPVERFLTFVPIYNHDAEHLYKVVTKILQDLGIDLQIVVDNHMTMQKTWLEDTLSCKQD